MSHLKRYLILEVLLQQKENLSVDVNNQTFQYNRFFSSKSEVIFVSRRRRVKKHLERYLRLTYSFNRSITSPLTTLIIRRLNVIDFFFKKWGYVRFM